MRRGPEPLLVECRRGLRCAGCPEEEEISIYVEDGRIAWIGGGSPPPGARSGHVYRCGRREAVIPCLYNAHTHAAMTLLRGFHDDSELHDWLARMWYVEKRLEPRIVYEASRLAIVEMLFSATCGFLDMYFMQEETARAAWELGVRARLGEVVMGDVDPHKAVEEALHSAEAIEARYGPLVRGVVNVHSVYAAPLEAVREAARAARERGLPLHIHASETRREVYTVKKRHGVFPVELLDRLGALWEGAVLVHNGWITSWELELVKRANATMVHCPVSNMKLATAGHMPFKEAMDMGINVALGTDGPASNNTLDMFREMRAAVLLQRHSYWDTRVLARHVLQAATEGSARALGVENGGRIEPGAPGDLAVVSLDRPGLMPLTGGRLMSHIVYAAAEGDAALVAVAGRPILSPETRERLLALAEEAAGRLEDWIQGLREGSDPVPPCSPRGACRA